MSIIPFNSPTTAIISGPTASGKSTCIYKKKFIKYIIFTQFGKLYLKGFKTKMFSL